ncbi:hypothetical protein F5I97DRAFT_1902519 [Phlebopus sp. FC_14]|nr:hypothetical protein F5I97DRAFT_1902519 [Phlebopus sp. FC_14]
MMYEPLVVRYATPAATTIVPIMLSADPLMTVMISSAVQLFIAWRVKVMSKSSFVPFVIAFFAVTSFIGGIATTVSVTIINEYSRLHQFDGAVITWLASSAAADIIITLSLVWSLYHKKTGFPATDDLINRLIRLTIQTGLITAVAATLDVTIFLAVKGTTLNYIWDFALSKLYSNCLLSTLNARGGWKSSSTVRENVLFGTTAVESSLPNTVLSENSYVKKPVGILYCIGCSLILTWPSQTVLFPKRNSTPVGQRGEYDIELRPHNRSYGNSGSELAGKGDTGIFVSKVVERFAESEEQQVYEP